jgi:hypothetical protein
MGTRVRRSKAALAGLYSGTHPKVREILRPIVEAGQAYCAEVECVEGDRWIAPGTPWDLAHGPSGQLAGPAHRKCNRRDGQRRQTAARAQQQKARHSRQW